MATVIACPPYFPGACANSPTLIHFPNTFWCTANPGRCGCSLRGPSRNAPDDSLAILSRHPSHQMLQWLHFYHPHSQSHSRNHLRCFTGHTLAIWALKKPSWIRLDSHRPDLGSPLCYLSSSWRLIKICAILIQFGGILIKLGFLLINLGAIEFNLTPYYL